MPRGTRHIVTGILRPGRWGYSLEVDGSGTWQLDVRRSARKLLGERVTVEGIRSGFDLLDVERLWRADEGPPAPPAIVMLLRRMGLMRH